MGYERNKSKRKQIKSNRENSRLKEEDYLDKAATGHKRSCYKRLRIWLDSKILDFKYRTGRAKRGKTKPNDD